jgi:NTP pyrophosphatase (non-canonical NTP hydrolase)
MNKIDLNRYAKFVLEVCSDDSKDYDAFLDRLDLLKDNYDVNIMSYGPQVNLPLLLTSGIGLASEGGEFNEIVKKIFFHGKSLSEENIYHMKRELGDIIWYWMNACNALGLDPEDVIAENVKKLEARYPGGKFSVYHSENRKKGDI